MTMGFATAQPILLQICTVASCVELEPQRQYGPLSSFPRKRESSVPSKSWIPARAGYRQLGRNDVRIIQRTLEMPHQNRIIG